MAQQVQQSTGKVSRAMKSALPLPDFSANKYTVLNYYRGAW